MLIKYPIYLYVTLHNTTHVIYYITGKRQTSLSLLKKLVDIFISNTLKQS